jgi:SynChlorMet cassette protein ScmC
LRPGKRCRHLRHRRGTTRRLHGGSRFGVTDHWSGAHFEPEPMNAPSLVLADGSVVVAADASAERVVQGVAATMGLGPGPAATRRVVVCGEPREAPTDAASDSIICTLRSGIAMPPMFHHRHVALAIARDAERRGGLLLHAALAARGNAGVILAGPSGVGKTTASLRLPPPWTSLCDDTTLVVRDGHGRFFAHPWPTWSHFFEGGGERTWSVADAVPLRAVCFLAQAKQDRADRVRRAEATGLLLESSRQPGRYLSRDTSSAIAREEHLMLFDRACALARAVPCFVLQVSLDGAFWHELDRILDGCAPQ